MYLKHKEPDFIPKEMIEASFNKFRENTFFMWLVKLFGQDVALDLQSKYNIGTAKNNGTIFFFQQDSEGKFRTGKGDVLSEQRKAKQKSVIHGTFTTKSKKILNWCKFFWRTFN